MTDLPRSMAISPSSLDDPSLTAEELSRRWRAWGDATQDSERTLIQIRTRRLPAARLFALVGTLADALGRELLVVNGRADVAMAARVGAVQLPEAGLPASAVRSIAGDRLAIGRSVHSVEGVREAKEDGADWVTLSPVFSPRSKQSTTAPLGLEILDRAAAIGIPVFALGGIDEHNRQQCLEHGAWGVAGVTLFADSAARRRALT